MINKIITLCSIALSWLSYSQEYNLPLHSQYLGDNPYLISPSFAGIGDNIQIRFSGLSQWVGVENAPDTQSVSVEGRLKDKSGLALVLFNDKNGNTRQHGGQVSFAHHLTLSEHPKKYLSFGTSLKYTQFNINNIDFGDDVLTTDLFSQVNINFDVSTLYRYNNFFVSVNVANILDKKLRINSISEPKKLRNYYAYSGYIFKKGRYNLEFEPSVLFQYYESDARSTTDMNFKVKKIKNIEDYLWAGVSYRFLNDQFFRPLALIVMLGLKKQNFYVGYGYQNNLNEIQQFNTGSHMITLGIDIFQGLSNCNCTH